MSIASPFHTIVSDLLGIRHPVLQGAMQGGGGNRLVAAVSEAGGLGVIPTFGGTEAVLRADIEAVRGLTSKPFGVNITPMGRGFTESRAAICVEMEVPIVTTGRADPGEAAVQMLKRAGITVVSVVPTVAHARRMVEEGVDAIVASGQEAGGHVGTVSTLPLVPQIVDAVSVPVIAAGGIGDARGVVAAFALGALGVQLGTRFMATPESNFNAWGKQRLVEMAETETLVTKSMTGAPVRCIATPEIRAYEAALKEGAGKDRLATLRREVRGGRNTGDAAERRQSAMGQIAGMIDDIRPVAELIEEMMTEAAAIARGLGRRVDAV